MKKKTPNLFAHLFDPNNWPDHMQPNPYWVRWKRGRPSKEAYEMREWAAGWKEAFYEAYPHLSPDYEMKRLADALKASIKIAKIKRPKNSRTKKIKYDPLAFGHERK